jgi:hypothetical protein
LLGLRLCGIVAALVDNALLAQQIAAVNATG